jgi:hypothetical protein
MGNKIKTVMVTNKNRIKPIVMMEIKKETKEIRSTQVLWN